MYTSSSSTSQQHSTTTNPPSTTTTTNHNPNLNTVDSIYGLRPEPGPEHGHAHQFFSSSELTSSSSSSSSNTLSLLHQGRRPYGIIMDDTSTKTMSSCGLIRQSSSPAGLLSHLASDNIGYGSGSKGFDVNYNGEGSSMGEHHMLPRQGPQLSFIRNEQKRSFMASQSRSNATTTNSSGFSLSAWDGNSNNNNSFTISTSSNKGGKTTLTDDFLNGLSSIDSEQAMEIDMMDRLIMHVPQNSVAYKIRAKRGCATHPRSIAERERRTRISGKLKKLQELVPNTDKQTSYADLLDLAVQHIKGLQGQIEKLNKELDHCTCGCKPLNV